MNQNPELLTRRTRDQQRQTMADATNRRLVAQASVPASRPNPLQQLLLAVLAKAERPATRASRTPSAPAGRLGPVAAAVA